AADRGVVARRDREIVEHVARGTHMLLQMRETRRIAGIDRGMADAGLDPFPLRRFEILAGARSYRGFRARGEGLVAQVLSRTTDDDEIVRDQPLAVEKIERRIEHALRQVARGAENDNQTMSHWES